MRIPYKSTLVSEFLPIIIDSFLEQTPRRGKRGREGRCGDVGAGRRRFYGFRCSGRVVKNYRKIFTNFPKNAEGALPLTPFYTRLRQAASRLPYYPHIRTSSFVEQGLSDKRILAAPRVRAGRPINFYVLFDGCRVRFRTCSSSRALRRRWGRMPGVGAPRAASSRAERFLKFSSPKISS